LAYLPETAVASYLAQRFGKQVLPEWFVRTLHQRTDGNPMLLVAVVDALVRQKMLTQGVTGWEFVGGQETRVMDIPENLRQFIDQQLLQLPAADRELLEVASVAGSEFIAAAVAAGLEDTEEAVDTRCDALARQGQFLRTHGSPDWPDGTMSARYGFLHDLYREALYEQVPASRRGEVAWADWTTAGSGPWRARELAAELAEHFMRGRDPERAVQYLRYAGENAPQPG
jgi:predicted ATPase